MKLDLIAGARPNFIKIAPIIDTINKLNCNSIHFRLIHTGQHYDKNMSYNIFRELRIPKPDYNLKAGGGTQAEQTGKIMLGYEALLNKKPADICVVVGDVTSTMACSIVAKKMCLKVAHVESGIRSGDLTMPEEINRIVTDSITDYFFTTSEYANKNLINAGVGQDRIYFVGNTMIDTLLCNEKNFVKPKIWEQLSLEKNNYIVMTLHRPANVDEENKLKEYIDKIISYSHGLPVIFPVHPRTAHRLKTIGISYPNLHLFGPLGYLEFNYLVKRAKVVITDSGGITEETTVMNIPCMTLRDNTERPETIELGTNELIGTDPKSIPLMMKKLFSGNWKKGKIPPLWDGKASERIINHILKIEKD